MMSPLYLARLISPWLRLALVWNFGCQVVAIIFSFYGLKW